MKRWLTLILLAVLMAIGVPIVAYAQTETSDTPAHTDLAAPRIPADFSSYDGGWLQMAYHPSLKAKVDVLQREAANIKSDLTNLLGKPVLNKVQVLVGRTPGEIETLAPNGARLPRYAAGVAFSEAGLILLTGASRYPGERHELLEVFRHELSHVALHDAVGRGNVPRWFNEGFAIYASKEAENARLQAMWTATLAGRLIPLKDLTYQFPADADVASIAYAQAADLVRYLLRNDDGHRFESLIQRLERGQNFDQALSDAYSADIYMLEKQWKKDAARRYTFWPVIFGGSLVWFVAFGLMMLAFVKRRRRSQRKLALWAKEEALEDARKRLAQVVISSAEGLGSAIGHVRILVAKVAPSTEGEELGRPEQEDAATADSYPTVHNEVRRPVPTVEHDGQRHTLH